ncbi:MAG: tetratricopeptide repeat protein [Bacteroidota bacterium]
MDIIEIERELIGKVSVQPQIGWSTKMSRGLCKKGHEHFHQQQYKEAIEYYTQALELQTTDEIAFCLGLAYYLVGDYNNARRIANLYIGDRIEIDVLPFFDRDTTIINKLFELIHYRELNTHH